MSARPRFRSVVPALLLPAVLVLAAIGCGADTAEVSSGAPADLAAVEETAPDATAMTVRAADDGSAVLFDDGRALHVVDPDTGAERFAAVGGRASGDGTVAVSAEVVGGETRVHARSTADGTTRWITAVDGPLEVMGVSRKGETVALADPTAPTGSTSIVVVRFEIPIEAAGYGLPPRSTESLPSSFRYDVAGEVEFDAFSTVTTALFVLHRSAADPDAYRVRTLDLVSGGLYDLGTRDKSFPEGDMYGRFRVSVVVPARTEVATLYTVGGSGSSGAAFIHLLNLSGYADCLDLPPPLGRGEPSTLAIAAPATGSPLHVFDSATGHLALLDPDVLGSVRTVVLTDPALAAGHPAAIALGPTILLAAGDEVVAVDGTGATVDRWSADGQVTGLVAIPGSTTVAAIVDGRVLLFGPDGPIGEAPAEEGRDVPAPVVTAPPTSGPAAPPSTIASPSISVTTVPPPPVEQLPGTSVPAGAGGPPGSAPPAGGSGGLPPDRRCPPRSGLDAAPRFGTARCLRPAAGSP